MADRINSYEDAIVEDKCVQAPLDEQCRNALEHYHGIARVAMHWSSLIEKAIKEYPALQADRKRLIWLARIKPDNQRAASIMYAKMGYGSFEGEYEQFIAAIDAAMKENPDDN